MVDSSDSDSENQAKMGDIETASKFAGGER